MKMTIITADSGELVGAMEGHSAHPDTSKAGGRDEFRAGLVAGPGQMLHEIEVPEELRAVKDPDEFGNRLMSHVLKEGLLS
jgi:hypothetical protein